MSVRERWKGFQHRRGLVVDGIPGHKTLDEVELLESEVTTDVTPAPSGFELSPRSVERMAGVHPDLQAVAHYAIRICSVDFGVTRTGGVRTPEMQAKLFAAGKSKKDGVRRRSRHQSGDALDVVAYAGSKADWSMRAALEVHEAFARAAKALGVNLRWGGDWDGDGDWRDERFVDAFHHERPRGAPAAQSEQAAQWMRAHSIEVT